MPEAGGLGLPMSSYELVNRLPILPILIVVLALVAYGAFNIYMRNRDQKGVRSQILLYSVLAVLFLIDFFLILKRDGFRASWTLTFWLALAAFMVGERVGRWSSAIGADEEKDAPPALK